jgi:hypothetical protein
MIDPVRLISFHPPSLLHNSLSCPFPGAECGINIHTKLVNDLLADGWEPVSEKGLTWWSYRFRRKLGVIRPKMCEIDLHAIKLQLLPPLSESKFEAITLGVEKTVIMESPIMIFKLNKGVFIRV